MASSWLSTLSHDGPSPHLYSQSFLFTHTTTFRLWLRDSPCITSHLHSGTWRERPHRGDLRPLGGTLTAPPRRFYPCTRFPGAPPRPAASSHCPLPRVATLVHRSSHHLNRFTTFKVLLTFCKFCKPFLSESQLQTGLTVPCSCVLTSPSMYFTSHVLHLPVCFT